MPPLLRKTFGGLSPAYYVRHFLFGVILSALVVFIVTSSGAAMPLGTALLFVVNTLLYPYARFVYEGIVSFVVGTNVFFVPALLALLVKLMSMGLCFGFALFIGPFGLAYLYFHHTRAERQDPSQ